MTIEIMTKTKTEEHKIHEVTVKDVLPEDEQRQQQQSTTLL